jgi:hypothetical protein
MQNIFCRHNKEVSQMQDDNKIYSTIVWRDLQLIEKPCINIYLTIKATYGRDLTIRTSNDHQK